MPVPSSSHDYRDRSSEDALTHALALFKLALPLHPTTLHQRYRELLAARHPHRCAGLTNNPAKYMQMYKKGEAMTREVEAAHRVLKAHMETTDPTSISWHPQPDTSETIS